MPEPVYRRDIGDDIRDLRKAADQAWGAARRRAPLKTIAGLIRVLAGGTITAENASETPVVSLGTFARNDGVQITGLAVRRSGGQEAFVAGHDADDEFTLTIRDGNQADVLGPGADGLNRPYLPVSFYRAQSTAWAPVLNTTTEAIWVAQFYRQHPYLALTLQCAVVAGTTLHLELYDADEAAVLESVVVAGPDNQLLDWTVPISGEHMDRRTFTLRGFQSGAAGNAIVQIYRAYSLPDA